MEGYIGGIALPTNVTLGSCLPSMLCVEDVYLTRSSLHRRGSFNTSNLVLIQLIFMKLFTIFLCGI